MRALGILSLVRARATTCQQLDREAQAEEDREHRGKGTRRLWSPSDSAQTVRDAIAAAQARARAGGAGIDAGEALAVVADHFVKDWERHHPGSTGLWSGRRRRVLLRKAGLCSVPGCSRAAVHVHHVIFRSRGGPKEEWNEIGICAVHHLHGIHLGYLEVSGRAGERLRWKFATGEAFVTTGDDDVRRAEREGAPASAPVAASAGRPGAGTRARGGAFEDASPPVEGEVATDARRAHANAGVTDVERAGYAAATADVTPGAAADPASDSTSFVAEGPDLASFLQGDAAWPVRPPPRASVRGSRLAPREEVVAAG
ncbi:MAG: hypothetical protein L6Q95_13410 [Planctomycetes bacterium]|nr:hypothetical protein [Planctomycetota bacterium]